MVQQPFDRVPGFVAVHDPCLEQAHLQRDNGSTYQLTHRKYPCCCEVRLNPGLPSGKPGPRRSGQVVAHSRQGGAAVGSEVLHIAVTL